jgi:hypothetical protein
MIEFSNVLIDTQQVRDAIGFDRYSLRYSELTVEEIDIVLALPQVDQPCLIKRKANRSGSSFDSMKEYGVVAGLMRGNKYEIKVLVVYAERPTDDGYEYGLVDANQVKSIVK